MDTKITFTIPEAKTATALSGFLEIYPNTETKDDPNWIDPKDGSTPPQVAKYTDKQWVQEQIRRIITREIRRGLQVIANRNAVVQEDNTLIQ